MYVYTMSNNGTPDRAAEAAEYTRKGREADALRAAGHGIHGSKVEGRYAHEWFSLARAVRVHFGV